MVFCIHIGIVLAAGDGMATQSLLRCNDCSLKARAVKVRLRTIAKEVFSLKASKLAEVAAGAFQRFRRKFAKLLLVAG